VNTGISSYCAITVKSDCILLKSSDHPVNLYPCLVGAVSGAGADYPATI